MTRLSREIWKSSLRPAIISTTAAMQSDWSMTIKFPLCYTYFQHANAANACAFVSVKQSRMVLYIARRHRDRFLGGCATPHCQPEGNLYNWCKSQPGVKETNPDFKIGESLHHSCLLDDQGLFVEKTETTHRHLMCWQMAGILQSLMQVKAFG